MAKMFISLLTPFANETQSLQDVFGRFASLLENCLIIHIEDANDDEMQRCQAEFKNMLTANTVRVEAKHVDAGTIDLFCRVIVTTNSEDAVKVSPTDRRWAAFHCSEELAKNYEYFANLGRYWNMLQVRQSVLRYLLTVELKGFSVEDSRPITSLMKHMRAQNICMVKLFVIGIARWIERNNLIARYRIKSSDNRCLIPQNLMYSLFEVWARASYTEVDIAKMIKASKISLHWFTRQYSKMIGPNDSKNRFKAVTVGGYHQTYHPIEVSYFVRLGRELSIQEDFEISLENNPYQLTENYQEIKRCFPLVLYKSKQDGSYFLCVSTRKRSRFLGVEIPFPPGPFYPFLREA